MDRYVGQLVNQTPDQQLVAQRRADINRLLKAAGILSTFESGSFNHGTAIPKHSDVDLMARIPYSWRALAPYSALVKTRDALATESYRFSSLKISSPAVKVQYSYGPSFEVAPAYFDRLTPGGDDVFEIPAPGEWVASAPSAHNRYVSRQNDRLGKRVKPLVRLLKAWKYHADVPVSSTYLELRTAEHAAGESSIHYQIDMSSILRKIVVADFREMNDPIGIVTRIRPCSSEDNRRKALAAAKSAKDYLAIAREAKDRSDTSSYWKAMYSIFGYDFPYPRW
ncbi:hypothetical protein DFR71_6260 [Nocardia alba]|uniref:Nucleotidyltransferase-like protein n=2 Tax=Nocardia alba TaxID=225051 RepID=A0A4R1FB79_9NOCA|nr:hypothetical protein DFR71_6260 [Nocardia alba]